MDELLDTLCTVLDRELERQENVLALCRAQQEDIRTRNAAGLEKKAAALQALLRDAIGGEFERHRVLRDLVETLELPPARQTLSELIAAVPDPWSSRLRFYQGRLQETLHETRRLVRENSLALRRSMQFVGQCLRLVQVEAPGAGRYTAEGRQHAEPRHACQLVDQVG